MEGFMIKTGFYDKCVLPIYAVMTRQQCQWLAASATVDSESGTMIPMPTYAAQGDCA